MTRPAPITQSPRKRAAGLETEQEMLQVHDAAGFPYLILSPKRCASDLEGLSRAYCGRMMWPAPYTLSGHQPDMFKVFWFQARHVADA